MAFCFGEYMLEPWIYLNNAMSNDLVAVWDIPLTDGIHTVELEHGTLTGKRVIRVDGKVLHAIYFYCTPKSSISQVIS